MLLNDHLAHRGDMTTTILAAIGAAAIVLQAASRLPAALAELLHSCQLVRDAFGQLRASPSVTVHISSEVPKGCGDAQQLAVQRPLKLGKWAHSYAAGRKLDPIRGVGLLSTMAAVSARRTFSRAGRLGQSRATARPGGALGLDPDALGAAARIGGRHEVVVPGGPGDGERRLPAAAGLVDRAAHADRYHPARRIGADDQRYRVGADDVIGQGGRRAGRTGRRRDGQRGLSGRGRR